MTITEAKKKVVALALSQVGTREGANNWNKFAADPVITRYYGNNMQNLPWCDIFVDWIFLTCFGFDIGSKMLYGASAACATSAQYFKNAGAFYKSPQLGDQSFYYSNGGINHTGIVVEIGDVYYTAVEGNYSDQVSKVRHRLNGSDTAGFGRPDWKLVQGSELKDDKETVSTGNSQNVNLEDHRLVLPLIMQGSKGPAVTLAQQLLNMRHFTELDVDGEFGRLTRITVIEFQKWAFPDDESEWDGKIGNKSWAKLIGVG